MMRTEGSGTALRLSPHAQRRQQQRSVSAAHIEAALRWGAPYRQGRGREAYFLGAKQVIEAERQGEAMARFMGTLVVVAPDGSVVTVVRTKSTARFRRWSN